MFDQFQNEWAPPDDAIIQLMPPAFDAQANVYYNSLECPAISKGTLWDIYTALLDHFHSGPDNPLLEIEFNLANCGADDEMELIPGLQELCNLDEIVGDMAIPKFYEADFTDSEEEVGNILAEDRNETAVYGDFTDSENE